MTGQLAPTEAERAAATRRPPGRPVMYQNWHDLLFLHWAVPPDTLRPLLPPGLDLDLYEGRAYVGLVPFTMTGVRPVGLPAVPPLSSFHETNIRTYVHRAGRDPGVWFFSLDAANALAVRIARAWYRLPYHFARMSMAREGETVDYATERLWPGPTPAACRVRYWPAGPVEAAQPGTLEHFLVERYILYAFAGGRLYTGRVHHAPYPLHPAGFAELDETMLAAASVTRPDGEPLAHYAREVRVRVYGIERAGADG